MHVQVSVHVQPNQTTIMRAHSTVFWLISFPVNVLNVQFVPVSLTFLSETASPLLTPSSLFVSDPQTQGLTVHSFMCVLLTLSTPVSGMRSPVTTQSELSSQDRSWQGSFVLQQVKSLTRLNYLPLCFLGSGAPLKWMFGLFWKETLRMLSGGWAPKKKPHSNSYSWVQSRGRAHW